MIVILCCFMLQPCTAYANDLEILLHITNNLYKKAQITFWLLIYLHWLLQVYFSFNLFFLKSFKAYSFAQETSFSSQCDLNWVKELNFCLCKLHLFFSFSPSPLVWGNRWCWDAGNWCMFTFSFWLFADRLYVQIIISKFMYPILICFTTLVTSFYATIEEVKSSSWGWGVMEV